MNEGITNAIEFLERSGVEILVARINGEIVEFEDPDQPDDEAPAVDPLRPVEFSEITALAEQAGVAGDLGFYSFPTRFWIPGVSAEMDAQLRENIAKRNRALFIGFKLGGGPFAIPMIYSEDGEPEQFDGVAMWTGGALNPSVEYFADFDPAELVAAAKAMITERIARRESYRPETTPTLPVLG